MNKRILEAFAKVGVLDSINPNRAEVFMNADAILSYASKSKESANSLSLFANTIEDDVGEDRLAKNLVKTAPWSFGQKLENELSALGFYISAHPLDQYKHLIEREHLATSAKLAELPDRANVKIAANVASYSHRKTKAGKDMLTINASDGGGNIDAIAFGDTANELVPIVAAESAVVLCGRLSNKDDRVSVFVDSVVPLAGWVAQIAKKITLDIRNKNVLVDIKKALATLQSGRTKVVLNLYSDDKKTTLAINGGVELGKNTVSDFTGLGIKVDIE